MKLAVLILLRTGGNPMHKALSILCWLTIAAGGLVLAGGCVELDPQTRAQQHAIEQNAAIDATRARTDQQVKDVKASGDVVAHPFAANNETIREIRTGCIWLARVATVATVVLFGLTFSPWGLLVKPFVIPAGLLAALGWVGTLALPFLPWVSGAVAMALLAWLINRMVAAHSVLEGVREWLAEITRLLHSGNGVIVEKVGSR